MKKILFLLAMILLCGCSESFEKFAKNRAVEYVTEKTESYVKKNNTAVEYFKVDSLNLAFINDSICAIDLFVKAKEYNDKEKSDKLQYIIFKDFFQSEVKGRNVYYEFAENDDYYGMHVKMSKLADSLGLKKPTFYEGIMNLRKYFTEVPIK